jgi:ribosomal protein S18 acetylase RimI-like enzyme
MTPPEFDVWKEHSITSYASDVAHAAGVPLEKALSAAREQFPRMLPDGLATAGTWLVMIVDGASAVVGTIWIGPHPDNAAAAVIYDIAIHESRRGHGLGRAAMIAAEQLVAAGGKTEIGLNVFGFNESARRLYDSLGYRVVSTTMTKTLPS